MPLAAPLDAAAEGRLPAWSRPSADRRAHMERVSALMDEWAAALELPDADRRRWRAAGLLHDALREEPPEQLRPLVPRGLRDAADKLLHGPAAAERLRDEGVHDDAVLLAIAYHTIGHPDLDDLGRALFIADYIEPGRQHDQARLAALRSRMPHDRAAVLGEVLRARLTRLLDERRPMRAETAAFWNTVCADASA